MARTGNYSLSLQLPLLAALSSLVIGLCVVWLAGTASSHMQRQIEARYGESLAEQIALATRDALQSGDLLAARATLERFIDSSEARGITIEDVEGSTIGAAGDPGDRQATRYRADIAIGSDIAGEVVVTVDDDFARENRWRFIFSLFALVAALSLLVFILTRAFAGKLAARLRALRSELSLPGIDEDTAGAGSELADLERTVAALPLEMLRGHATLPKAATQFDDSVIVFVHLASLARYVDRLSESNLHRYTRRLQQIVQAAAHCYRGEITVTRPFGLVLRFADQASTGSEALRAASCARLIALIAERLRSRTSLSLDIAMALGRCEESPEDVDDIYPQLHLQGAIDDLREACLASESFPAIHVERDVLSDDQLQAAADRALVDRDNETAALFVPLLALSEDRETLIEHQAKLIASRIAPSRETGETPSE